MLAVKTHRGEGGFVRTIKRVNTILYCRHWENTVSFYRDVLSFSIHYQTQWFVEFRLMGDTYLSIANAECASIKSTNGGGITLSLQIEDVESTHLRLHGLGIKTGKIKSVWGSQAFYIFDPEGHRLELWS
jgi:catechol 2,3-dioxygenase-like lactoylglutathione lyase family enzyme